MNHIGKKRLNVKLLYVTVCAFTYFLSQEASLIIKMCLQSHNVLATEPPSNSFTAISAFGMKKVLKQLNNFKNAQITDNIILNLIK